MRFPTAARFAAASALTLAACLAANGVRAQPGSTLDALPPAVCPPNGSEETYGVQNGADRKFTAAQVPFCLTSQPTTYTRKQSFAPTTSITAGVNLGQGVGPTTPVNGDLWVTPSGVFAEVNGVTAALGVTVPTAAAAGSPAQVQYNCSAVLCGASGLTISGGAATLASPTLTGTVTLPGTGTLTSTLNTFAKPVLGNNTANALEIGNGGAGFFGCGYLAATSPANTFALGLASTSTGSCANPIVEWGQSSGINFLTLTAATTLNNTLKVFDPTGATELFGLSFPGSVPTALFPNGAVVQLQASLHTVGISGGGVGVLDVGNGTAGDTSGTVVSANVTATSKFNWPDLGFYSTTVDDHRVPIDFLGGGNRFASVSTGNAFVGQDTASPGGGFFIRAAPPGAPGLGPESIYSPYLDNYQFSLMANTQGRPVLGMEAGPSDAELVIGSNAAADNMAETAGLIFADSLIPAGVVQTVTVTAGGTNYTSSTTTASVTGGGCTSVPGITVAVNNTTGAVVGVGFANGSVAEGCTSPPTVTINSSGAGTGATATAVLTSGTETDASVGPMLLFHQWVSPNINPHGLMVGFGLAGLTTVDLRMGLSSGGWQHPFDGGAGYQAYLRLPGGIAFERPNGGHNNATFSFTSALQDCQNQTNGTSAGFICLTTTEGGSTLAGIKARLITPPVAVASLPASPVDGEREAVSDSTVAASGNFGAAVVGGGTNHVAVYYDGGSSTWRIG